MQLSFKPTAGVTSSLWRVVAFMAAVWLLNAMLTFHNVWPTAAIHPSHELSIELACVLLILAAWLRVRASVPRPVLVVLAVLFVFGALGRYAEVTAPALYGREVNLYWDMPHLGSVAAMLTRVASPWLLFAGTVGVVAGFALLYFGAFWSWLRVANALQSSRVRLIVSVAAVGVIIGFTRENLAAERPEIPWFSMPIAMTYGEQVAKVGAALMERGTMHQLPPSPKLESTLSRLQGSDVIVVFIESYGRVAYDNRDFFETFAPARSELAAAARDTGRAIASGFVVSPTFGGGSWLAHLSFLSGIEMRDAGQAQLLMTQARRTLGNALAEHGYRRVGLMPGLKAAWPEGVFYGFDQIYDDAALGYDGPAFGWWRIPDQFSLAKLDALERTSSDRKPLFVVFPTINTHTPFIPVPPYQADWSRMLSATPFDAAPLRHSLSQEPNWDDLSGSYKGAVSYTLETLAGYVRSHAHDDFVMIILGDHQPPAMVSGTNASWDVPVHVITSKPALMDALKGCGLVPGMIPAPQAIGPMNQLGLSLLYAAEEPGPTRKCPMQPEGGAPTSPANDRMLTRLLESPRALP